MTEIFIVHGGGVRGFQITISLFMFNCYIIKKDFIPYSFCFCCIWPPSPAPRHPPTHRPPDPLFAFTHPKFIWMQTSWKGSRGGNLGNTYLLFVAFCYFLLLFVTFCCFLLLYATLWLFLLLLNECTVGKSLLVSSKKVDLLL